MEGGKKMKGRRRKRWPQLFGNLVMLHCLYDSYKVHTSLVSFTFSYLWHKADFAVSAIKTVNIKITETVKVKKRVQEAQKTELIYCPGASF